MALLNLEPRDWRSYLGHLPEFTISTKVLVRLDHTNPTQQSLKLFIMHNKASRMLSQKLVQDSGAALWLLLAACLVLIVR